MHRRTFGTLAALGLLAAGCAPEPEARSVARIIDASPSLSTFAAALDAGELTGRLAGVDAYTVFAPPNPAFETLPPDVLDAVLLGNQDELRRVLRPHLVAGIVTAAELAGRTTELTSLDGVSILVDGAQGLTIRGGRGGGARVLEPDVMASNGVIHVIDRVLLP